MKRNTLEKLYITMKYELPEIHLEDWIIRDARASIDRMLEISAKAGVVGDNNLTIPTYIS